MNANLVSRAIAFFVLVPLAVSAQVAREHDPTRLTNWPAPLYWQPGVAPEATATPQAETTTLPLGSAALVFVATTPCRVMDTRQGQGFTGAFGPPSIAAGLPVRTIPIQSSTTCSIPSAAQAYSFNVTAVPPGSLVYITLYPATANPQPAPPNASTLNDPSGTIIANAAIVPAGTDGVGSVDVYASGTTDLIIDINGYYAPQSAITVRQGTAAAASVSFAGDSGTGMYSSGTGIVNLAAGGMQALSVGSALNLISLGAGALTSDTIGHDVIAIGALALQNNTTGNGNIGIGSSALQNNTTGSHNTATGGSTLAFNTTGTENTADGHHALNVNTGSYNTAIGAEAMVGNTTGNYNTAVGDQALTNATTANNNTVVGQSALSSATTGSSNTASGTLALEKNATGCCNTGHGAFALENLTTGSNNIAIGYNAGFNLSGANSNNIHIGNQGSANDSGAIRIGIAPGTGVTSAQTSFFAAGIRGTTTGNSDAIPVVIDSNGQLGTVSSSRRFKEDIHDMGGASSGLLRLRPVTFRYRQPFADGAKPVQYGLIAEEVEVVYPDLVAHSADGQIESVKYQVLDSMLLNEVQKQAEQNRQQAEKIRSLEDRLAALEVLLPKAAAPAADHQ